MRIMAILIGLVITLFLVMALVKDYTGAQKGDGEARTLAPIQAAEETVKKLNMSNSPLKQDLDKAVKSE